MKSVTLATGISLYSIFLLLFKYSFKLKAALSFFLIVFCPSLLQGQCYTSTKLILWRDVGYHSICSIMLYFILYEKHTDKVISKNRRVY